MGLFVFDFMNLCLDMYNCMYIGRKELSTLLIHQLSIVHAVHLSLFVSEQVHINAENASTLKSFCEHIKYNKKVIL